MCCDNLLPLFLLIDLPGCVLMHHPRLLAVVPLVPAGPDLEEAIGFYVGQLGFSLTWRAGDMAGIKRGHVELNLVANTDPGWLANASFGMAVDDLEGFFAECQGTTGRIGPLEVKAWGRREFHLIVPSGVCLQFFERS